MKKQSLLLFLFLLLLHTIVHAQQKVLDDTVVYHMFLRASGNFSKTNDFRAFVLNNQARFNMEGKNIFWQTSGGWVYGEQSGSKINDDYFAVLESDILRKRHALYYWAIGTYDKSYSLKIDYRFQVGGGLALTIKDSEDLHLIISDGLIYEEGNLTDFELGERNYGLWRNSLRLKFRWHIWKTIHWDGSAFIQPSLSTPHDNIIRVNTALSVKIKQWLGVTSTLSYNKLSLSGRENLIVTYGILIENTFRKPPRG